MMSRRIAIGAIVTTAAAIAANLLSAKKVDSTDAMLPQSHQERPLKIISPALLEQEAKTAMPEGAFEYVHGGAGDEWTLRQNGLSLQKKVLRPHRLGSFSKADTSATLLGRLIPAPIYVCPMGAQDIVHADAEIASAKGAALAKLPYILSSAANRSIEEVVSGSPGAFRFFAIYLNKDASVNRSLAKRARDAGYQAIVMTVDSLGPGESERYQQLGSPKSPIAGYGSYDPRRGGIGDPTALRRDFSPADVDFLREASNLPVFVKGILRSEDAERNGTLVNEGTRD